LGMVLMLSPSTLEVTVKQTGTLQATVEAIEDYSQDSVTSLTIITAPGEFLNYADFTYMREQLPNLSYLDLTEADCLNDYDPQNPVEHEIPRNAMRDHKTLKTIVLSEKVTSIGRAAFGGCASLCGDLVIPDNIVNIGELAFGFYGDVYPQFDSLTLSNNLKSLGAGAFLRCKISGGLTIPASLETTDGNGAAGGVFHGCGFSGPLVFEEGSKLKNIASYMFVGCTGLTGDLTIPDSVTSIGNYAFDNCTGLTGALPIGSSVVHFTTAPD